VDLVFRSAGKSGWAVETTRSEDIDRPVNRRDLPLRAEHREAGMTVAIDAMGTNLRLERFAERRTMSARDPETWII
jgi:hypothetical protein